MATSDTEVEDWRTKHSDQVKREHGLVQVDGVLWEQRDE